MWPMSHALYPGLSNQPPSEHRPRTAASDRTWRTAESRKTWYGNHRHSYASSRRTNVSEVPGENLGDLIQRSNHMLSALSENGKDAGQGRRTSRADCIAEPSEGVGGSSTSCRYRQSSVQDEGNAVARATEQRDPRMSLPPYQADGSKRHVTSEADLPVVTDLELATSPQHEKEGSNERLAALQDKPSLDSPQDAAIASQGWACAESTPAQPTEVSARTSDLSSDRPPDGCRTSQDRLPLSLPEKLAALDSFSTWDSTAIEHPDKESSDPKRARPSHSRNGGVGSYAEEDDADSRLSGLALVSVITSLSIAVFLVAMDVNVIATAIPHITGEFRSLDDIGWYGSAFLMATCACQIPYGRVYSLFAAKWVFLTAIAVFMAGSLIAATARSSAVLIFGRAIQGVGTSGILSGGLIIMSEVVPLRLRPVLTGVVGAMEGIAMISAPIIGGVLTDRLNWRWCFYVNLPIGGVVLLVVLLCLRVPVKSSSRPTADMTWLGILRHLDVLGALALLPPIVCTLLALHYAGNGGSWGEKSTILLFVLAVVLFALFAYTQYLNAEVALIPWRVIKQRSILSGFWFILCVSSALVVITYFLPLWFQTIRDTSAQQSGIAIIPMLVAVIAGVLGSGALVSAVGYYVPMMLASSALMPVGLGLLSTINPHTSRAALLAYPAIFGLGVGVGFQQPLTGVQTVLSQSDVAAGTSIIIFGQTFGAAIIIAAGESVFQKRLAFHIAADLGLEHVNTPQLLGTGPSALTSVVTQDQLPLLIRAVSGAITDTFYLALAMAALSIFGCIFMEWKSVKKVARETEA